VKKEISISFRLFLILWALTLVLPYVVGMGWPLGGLLLGLLLPVLWVTEMPCTCFRGAIVAPLLAMAQLGSASVWAVLTFRAIMHRL
jgi:hypothetical protein